MAKQSFVTGQVLTAAQMTSLQQTAMLGGAASAKTASYTLVAADAGTAITMSNASATTITVNTALFAAGDTVQITNLGAGVCTITAGTATVNSSASLALAQYESGTLDFTSASAAIFIKGAGAAASSGGMTLISTTSLSGASTTISSIPGTYKNLQLVIRDLLPATDGTGLNMRLNGDSTANRYVVYPWNSAAVTNLSFDDTQFGGIVQLIDNGVTNNLTIINLYDYANTDTYRYGTCQGVSVYSSNTAQIIAGNYNLYYNQTSAITSITLIMGSGNITSGTALLYGVS